YNPKSGWAVLSIHADGESVTAVGSVINPREGDEYEFRGSFVTDPKWGRQFKFSQAEVFLPCTRKGVIRYLASIAYGVGEVRAARIVGVLGDDCLARLQADPSLLDGLTFLTEQQREEIKIHLREHRTVAEVSGLICREGLTPNLAAKIVARFGEDAVRIVKEEPYRLTEIEGIGFLTADRIAMAVGIKPDAPARIQAAIRHVLSEAENEGHCYLRPNDLVREVPALLGTDVGVSKIAEAVKALIEAEVLVRDGDDIYLKELHEAECEVAEWVRATAMERSAPIPNLEGLIDAYQTNAGITYHPKQRDAIRMALTSGFSVITGGPGTGKTQITKAIVHIYTTEHRNKPVYLCSPTGRAAKRLSEATGAPASTIHRLLGYNPELGFMVNEEEPLKPGLLIADEASMMDIRLARSLLAACSQGMQVVLIGDVDQLPSVGPGSVLRDIIESSTVPVTRLEYVYRQEEGSGISALAHQVNQGELPSNLGKVWSSELKDGKKADVFVVQIDNPDEALPMAMTYAKQAYGEFGLLGFGVLAPGHRGSAGVKALNNGVRSTINPHASKSFSPGDRVMVIKNNYKHDVFNGDLGIVRSVNDEDGSIEVDFGDQWVTFGTGEDEAPLDILQLAFASTIHKSQGGEYPVCIVVLTRQHWIMLARNMLYTAVTRAKKRLVIIHQAGCIPAAVRNNKIAHRNSRLAERLRGGATQ
ncbi:MAG TPA: ATP-dependent RecD-like DNA helicase, partial [Firmicutes bacterium]|nr:ATP-dependent RecD-like DNA helicase [Candidatus Fermentithermobacillaceae bacterium]